ncbi:MAG: cyclic nucleotide-binding domain-containing protein [Chloroflexales bacterium]
MARSTEQPVVDEKAAEKFNAHVLTVDIVDFSLREDAESQTSLVQHFIQLLHKAIPEGLDNARDRVWSPAGDGGSLTFPKLVTAPLETAINLARLVGMYNEGKFEALPKPRIPLQLRMGIHTGAVSMERDFDERTNVWGNGVNISARLITLARPGQILVSEAYYNMSELAASRNDMEVRHIGKGWVKHNKSIVIYNVYSKGAGIPFEETDGWFGPFQYPLQQAIRTYQGMLTEEYVQQGNTFRIAVLAKRLLDLETSPNPEVTIHGRKISLIEIIRSISEQKFGASIGQHSLYDRFFSPLSPAALVYFFQNAQFEVYYHNQELAREDEKADRLMIIISGTVGVYRKGTKLRVVDAKSQDLIDVAFGEGQIVGEMGLFNPQTRRNATLIAERPTIVLSKSYETLRVGRPGSNAVDDRVRIEIRKQVWRYYRERTRDSHIASHPLLRELNNNEKALFSDHAEFLPDDFQGGIQCEANDLWEYWNFLIAGQAIVYTNRGEETIEFKSGECIGLLRLVMETNPYNGIEFSQDAQLIRIHWDNVADLIKKNPSLDQICTMHGREERRRLGLIL